MAPEKFVIFLDPVTAAVLRAYAGQRRQPTEDAIAALLYRQAAQMSGWPGQAGQELERALLRAALPTADEQDDPEI
jgi:predicted kinase